MTSAQFESIAQEALGLSEFDRHWFAERLWWSRQPASELDAQWDAALLRRVGGGCAESTEQSPLLALTNTALKLVCSEREALALRLWASIDDPEEVAAAWDAEIERRVKEIEAGTVELIPSEEVFARGVSAIKAARRS